MQKTYKSVGQMVRETADGAFAQAFEERLRERRVVKDLMVLRARRGLTQADVAEKMGCTQSRISKLESARDVDLTLGDLARYAGAVGYRLGVVLEPTEMTAVGRVKRLASQIREELSRLAGPAREDQQVAEGLAGFFSEAFFNLVGILQRSAEERPDHPEDGERLISFEIIDREPESQPGPTVPQPARREPRRQRRRSKPVGVGSP
jgi:transcriptional regulator with XRE-family HTH domain